MGASSSLHSDLKSTHQKRNRINFVHSQAPPHPSLFLTPSIPFLLPLWAVEMFKKGYHIHIQITQQCHCLTLQFWAGDFFFRFSFIPLKSVVPKGIGEEGIGSPWHSNQYSGHFQEMNSVLEESKQRHQSDQSWWEYWTVLGFGLRLKHCYIIVLLPCALFSPTLTCESERKSWLRRWGHFADGEVLNVVTEALAWSVPCLPWLGNTCALSSLGYFAKLLSRPLLHRATCPESRVHTDASQSRWFLLHSTWSWNEMDFWWKRLGNSTFN